MQVHQVVDAVHFTQPALGRSQTSIVTMPNTLDLSVYRQSQRYLSSSVFRPQN
jgi:hypothetical protein